MEIKSEMRLIDADVLSDAFDDEGADLCLYGETLDDECLWGFSYSSVHDLINKAPAVDAVPIVHCKDCKFSKPDPWSEGWVKCETYGITKTRMGYCDYGRKRVKE